MLNTTVEDLIKKAIRDVGITTSEDANVKIAGDDLVGSLRSIASHIDSLGDLPVSCARKQAESLEDFKSNVSAYTTHKQIKRAYETAYDIQPGIVKSASDVINDKLRYLGVFEKWAEDKKVGGNEKLLTRGQLVRRGALGGLASGAVGTGLYYGLANALKFESKPTDLISHLVTVGAGLAAGTATGAVRGSLVSPDTAKITRLNKSLEGYFV